MHDFFDVIGLPGTTRPVEVRRICAKWVRRCHPDFHTGGPASAHAFPADLRDVAVDFAEMSSFVDRIQLSFFDPRN